MYTKSWAYYDIIYHFIDYRSQSKVVTDLIRQRTPKATTLLELACGTGKFIKEFREQFSVEGLDLDRNLLSVARLRCPDVMFHSASMDNFNIDREYDAIVCLFSSIAYVKTRERLVQTINNVAKHLSDDGVCVIEPWFTPDQYWDNHTKVNCVNRENLKICWMYVQQRKENVAILDKFFTVSEGGEVYKFNELHELGLFSHQDFCKGFLEAGLNAEFLAHGKHGLFIARKCH